MINFKNKDIVSKMTIIGIAAISLLIIVISVVLVTTFSGDDEPTTATDETETTDTVVEDETDKVFDRALAVVNYVDAEADSLMIYDIEDLTMVTLKMNSAIEIKDEYGTDIVLAQIDVGDMVEVKYDTISMVPEDVRITAKTWERKDVSNMEVDTESKVIKISNDVYSYTDELVTSDNGKAFDISQLSTADEALVKGYKDTVWSVVLVNGHGTVTLVNHDVFIGGQLQVGNRLSYTIESDMSIPLAAGVHQIVVSKDNMTPYVKQIMVEEDQEVIIDLSEAQPKVGQVDFLVLQDGVTVYINDEPVDLTEEIVLDFGTYQIKAEAENYVTWESELVLSQAYQQFKIDLDKTPTYVFINQPEGADVYMDDVLIGTIPTQAPFTPGSHTIQLRREGYITSEAYKYLWEDDGMNRYLVLPQLIQEAEENTPEETEGTEETDTVVEDIYGTTGQ